MKVKDGRKPKGYWTKEKCFEQAKKYKNRTRWMKGHQTSYQTARRKEWLAYCSVGMEKDINRKPKGYWTEKTIFEEALKYTTRSEWSELSGGSFGRASDLGILELASGHMKKVIKFKQEVCFSYARKVKSKRAFREKFSGAYSKSLSKDWYNNICELNGWEYTPQVPWTKELILETTKGYTNLKDWVRDNHHRNKLMARRLGVYNKCVKLIKKNANIKHKNIINNLLKTTKGYNSYEEWCKTQPRAYEASKRYLIKTKIRDLISENKRKHKRLNY